MDDQKAISKSFENWARSIGLNLEKNPHGGWVDPKTDIAVQAFVEGSTAAFQFWHDAYTSVMVKWDAWTNR